MIRKSTWPNGFRVITNKMTGRESVALGFMVGTGGRYEPDRIKGAAHFLEHILFKGSRRYSCAQIKELIEGVGGALNAFTSEEKTCYYAKIPARHWKTAFGVLSDMVSQPLITSRDVDKERTVIMEEAKMYHDLPHYYVLELLDGLLWPGHPLGKNLIGTMESLTGMTHRALRSFRESQYVPNSMVLSACGRIDHKDLNSLAGKIFGRLADTDRPPCVPVSARGAMPRTAYDPRPIEQMHLALGFLGYPQDHPDRYVLNVMNIILGGNMSSRLFNEVREKRGLAYSIASSVKYLKDTGVIMIRAGVDNNKIVNAADLIRRECLRIGRNGITPDELKRAKDYYLGQLLLGLEDTLDHMLWIADSLISQGILRDPKEIIRAVRRIRADDVQRVAKDVLTASHLHLAVVGPLKTGQVKQLDRMVARGA